MLGARLPEVTKLPVLVTKQLELQAHLHTQVLPVTVAGGCATSNA